MEELERLAKSKNIRTADRANIRSMLDNLRKGKKLTYQEVQNLWAYIGRYRSDAPGE